MDIKDIPEEIREEIERNARKEVARKGGKKTKELYGRQHYVNMVNSRKDRKGDKNED